MPISKNLTRRITPGTLARKETSLAALSPGRSDPMDFSEPRNWPRQPRGLTSRTSRGVGSDEQRAQEQENRQRGRMKQFITDNFKCKKCHYFVPQKSEENICKCGAELDDHPKFTKGTAQYLEGKSGADNDLGEGKPGEEWSKAKHIREIITDAYGEINFINEKTGGHKPAKFVRISDNTDVEKALELMTGKELWNMNYPFEPNLIITVIGGAKNFRLDGKKKEIFNRGLVEAAQSTHAWIITSGCNMGCMKAVGEAVEERQTYQWDRFGYTHTLRCIGIAPWGYVERNKVLTEKGSKDEWFKTYTASNKIVPKMPVSLNPNHTHFLLIDDGMRGKYQGSTDFRAKLEGKLAERGKHVLLMVLEGGTDAIVDASSSLKRNIPVVLCEGTGRAADILSYAYNYSVAVNNPGSTMKMASKHHDTQLDDMLMAAYGKTWEERSTIAKELPKYRSLVLQCCERKQLISVFDMNKDEALDVAILAALLKGQGASEKDTDQLYEQLTLALTWNRSDVAEEKIFNKDINWPEKKLDDAMMKALLEDKVNFVRLLLNNGVIMKDFLTVKVLRTLYHSDPNNHLYMYNMLKQHGKKKCTLKDVNILLQKLKMRYVNETYDEDEHGTQDAMDDKNFDQPFRELFIWAVLTNRHEMAKFLWERGINCISSALAATKLYLSMAERVEQFDLDLKENFLQNKGDFEHLAVKVLDECHYTHPENAAEILERKCEAWHNLNCLQIAAGCQAKEFLSSVACQKTLDKAWNKGISAHWYKIPLCILLPFFIPKLVEFEDDMDKSPCNKMFTFYNAPVVKFASNTMMYLIFLIAYSYMLMFEYSKGIGVLEIVLTVWIFTMILEEIREMFFLSKANDMIERLKVWWNFSSFNRIDLIIIIISVLGFLFRINGAWGGYIPAKTVYCVNCVLFFVRSLSFYSASSYLGPKLVMIARMVEELLLYIMILLVFLLAYGVATLSLQYPSRQPYWGVLRDIFYYPYWQIYGELFLEELEGRTDNCLDDMHGNATMSDGRPCPEFSWLVPLLTALYLLIGNVLLLNLLIAIFTNVFEEVNTNSIQIWKFGMYFLVVEYDVKPSLAPPFIFFEHVVLGIKFICQKICCNKGQSESEHTSAQLTLLNIFEREMQKSYLMRCMNDETDNIELKINKIHHRVDEVTKLLKAEQLMAHQHNEGIASATEGGRPSLQRRITSQGHAALTRGESTTSFFDDDPQQSKLEPILESKEKESNLYKSSTSSIKDEKGADKEMKFRNLVDAHEDPYAGYNFGKLNDPSQDPGYDHIPADRAQTKHMGKAEESTDLSAKTQHPPVTAAHQQETAQKPPVKASPEPKKQDPYYTESEDEKPKRKPKTKKKKRHSPVSSDDENEMVLGHSAGDYRLRNRKHPNVTPRGADSRLGAASSDAWTARESQQAESDIERRLGDLESTTTAQLGNIEILLRNMMFQQPGRVAPQQPLPVGGADVFNSPRPQRSRLPIQPPIRAFGGADPSPMPRVPQNRDQSPTQRSGMFAPPPQPYAGYAGFDNAAFQRQEVAPVYTTGAPLGGGLRRPASATGNAQQQSHGNKF